MKASSLTEVAEELLAQAENSHSGRAAQTVYGGHDRVLRQTVIALAAGHELAEHESPGEATLQVLTGRVRLTAGDDAWEGTAGDLVAIPPARHALARCGTLRDLADRAPQLMTEVPGPPFLR